MNRSIPVVILFATVALASCESKSPTAPNAPATDTVETDTELDPIQEALGLLNQRRAESGLTPVEADSALEIGCAAHVEYMRATDSVIHQQDTGSPHFSSEGAAAAENATLSGNVASLSDAIEAWLAEPYHRLPLLHPGLTKVGGAHADGYACLDIYSAAEGVEDHPPIPYPGRNASNVPTTYEALGAATPLPPGWTPPVGTVISYQLPSHWVLHGTPTVSLTPDDTAEGVGLWIGLPHQPKDPYASFQGNTILAIPESPLLPGTTYSCLLEGQTIQTEGGEPGPLVETWSFTTSN